MQEGQPKWEPGSPEVQEVLDREIDSDDFDINDTSTLDEIKENREEAAREEE